MTAKKHWESDRSFLTNHPATLSDQSIIQYPHLRGNAFTPLLKVLLLIGMEAALV
ncbi:hypothetical protein Ataiwa_02280 [Algoriphagus taiwanensis]|uniref:Uncharacterized protein n=1 Tax=Algoriphagus taiwanensis TaxID=1445656 RepID=A0ABQ6PVG2_9BACT|nr:hypothetical protein Ataiwa_02280 [Algoriphagus taiwanensis]